ncbi:endoglucanase-like isoform X2 [Cylas formicarius]|uniref:endoglucanase-like isoform X2 n=1 Tax=Cylas formicarius TaxID=197179 RepID=UPI002958BBE5|nr:endoglucanase-like isoform X2 [Cylas formicarius]
MLVLIPLSIFLVQASAQAPTPIPGGKSGSGTTTRYWDCCKPSCAWVENLPSGYTKAVDTCSADGVTVVNASVQSSCGGGGAYMCNDQQPFAVSSTLAYGFAAASFTGGADVNLCCACFLLTFQDQIQGKQMVLQVTNTGGDLGQNQFDIALPGGGVGIFTQGCQSQWNTPWNGWGNQYGGVSSKSECSQLPEQLQAGCEFRFDFFQNADNPQVQFQQVECPSEILSRSNCSP